MKLRHVSTAFLVTCLLLLCSQGQAEVIVTGDVDPSGATDPWVIDGELKVGNTGEGTLNITDGGVVSNTTGYIGYDDDTVGTVTVTGQGSEWNNSGGLEVGSGYSGEGTLNIKDGGVVSSAEGTIGLHLGSVGTATVTGEGSEWNNSSSLYVSLYGDGTLNITDGGVVSNTWGVIGYGNDDSVGTVTVTGQGSEWNNSSSLTVGQEGTLNVKAGGVVTNTYGSIGYEDDTVGTVTVTGKDSEWNNSEDLIVGKDGTGTLNITDGSVVNVSGATTLNNSTLHIELSDPTSGPFLITDVLELGGAFEISLADGFLPELGNSFDILDFNTASGNFAEMNLPALEDSLVWDTSELLTRGALCVGSCPAGIEGDFNYDGSVDAADFTVWQDNLGLTASVLNGNGSGAATVVQADYLLWKTNFEALATGSEGTAAVPEPVTPLLALLALVAAPLRVRCG
jgi:T5SS/PEP-CTERM-associated repeat protein